MSKGRAKNKRCLYLYVFEGIYDVATRKEPGRVYYNSPLFV